MSTKCSGCGVNYVAREGDYCVTCQVRRGGAGKASAPHPISTRPSEPVPVMPLDSGDKPQGMLGRTPSPAAMVSTPPPPTPMPERRPREREHTRRDAAPVHGERRVSYGNVAISGRVRDYSQRADAPLGIVRWGYAMFMAIPFCMRNDLQMFKIIHADTSHLATGKVSDDVVVLGLPYQGAIGDGNSVTVHGVRRRNGTVLARQVVNETSGTRMTLRMVIPWWMTWVILALIVVIGIGIYRLVSGVSGMDWAGTQQTVISILLLVALVLWVLGGIGRSVRRARLRTRLLVVAALAMVGLYFFMPGLLAPVGTLILMAYGLYMLVRGGR